MKPLRYLLATAVLTIGVFSIVLYSSCTKNKCGSTTCQNGGTCSKSVCICPTGYSGNSCQTGWSDVSIGTYNCVRSNCSPKVGGDSTWQSAITKAATNGGYTVNITNFDKSGVTVSATIDSAINGQSRVLINTATGTSGIQASGYYVGGKITLEFTSSIAGGIGGYHCSMTLTKL